VMFRSSYREDPASLKAIPCSLLQSRKGDLLPEPETRPQSGETLQEGCRSCRFRSCCLTFRQEPVVPFNSSSLASSGPPVLTIFQSSITWTKSGCDVVEQSLVVSNQDKRSCRDSSIFLHRVPQLSVASISSPESVSSSMALPGQEIAICKISFRFFLAARKPSFRLRSLNSWRTSIKAIFSSSIVSNSAGVSSYFPF